MLKIYTFDVDDSYKFYSYEILAVNQKVARELLWLTLTAEQRDNVASIDLVEEKIAKPTQISRFPCWQDFSPHFN